MRFFDQFCSALAAYYRIHEKVQRLATEYYNTPMRRPSPCEEKGVSPDQNDTPKPTERLLQLTNGPVLAQPGPSEEYPFKLSRAEILAKASAQYREAMADAGSRERFYKLIGQGQPGFLVEKAYIIGAAHMLQSLNTGPSQN